MRYAIWADFPWQLPSEEVMAKRLRIMGDDFDDFAEIYAHCKGIAQPKFLYREAAVTVLPNDDVLLGDTLFHSRILNVNMQGVQSVFAYVATCGRELFDYACSCTDPLQRFWVDSLSEALLRDANRSAHERLTKQLGVQQLFAMNPGSLPDWPISQQKPLFSLIGSVYEQIGVELTDSFLMVPFKSGSGIYYASETEFVSCTHCARGRCPNRRAPFDPDAFAEKYGK